MELIRQPLAALEVRLHELVRSRVEFIELIGEDLLEAGGKRARPRLAFLAALALGANTPNARQIDFAAVIELLHSASLLHDDLVDDAETRRGHVAAFRRYGNAVSVLSGDYLLARLLETVSDFGPETVPILRLVANTARLICEGEVLQFQVAALETYSFEHYLDIITGKTAALAAAATEGAAILQGASETVRQAMREFGLQYGRAFQMRDDLLDMLADEKTLGKPTGGDLREGKATLPILYLFEDTNADVATEAREIVRRRANQDGDVARMRELMLLPSATGSAFERTRNEIQNRTELAVQALAVLPVTPARLALEELAAKESERVA